MMLSTLKDETLKYMPPTKNDTKIEYHLLKGEGAIVTNKENLSCNIQAFTLFTKGDIRTAIIHLGYR